MNTKKKPVKDGLRNIGKNLIRENEIEQNLRNEIAKEIHNNNKKK